MASNLSMTKLKDYDWTEMNIFNVTVNTHLKSYYTPGVPRCITVNKTKMLRFIFALFYYFSLSPIVINMEIFVKDFSGTTWPRILKVGTNIRYDKLNCV